MSEAPRTVVVMGVSGTGKTSVATPLARKLGWTFLEGDDLHPDQNVAKMSAQIPLTDEDRWPWLRAIGAAILTEHAAGRSVVVTCSSLRRAYRDVLREADPEIVFVHLTGKPGIIMSRMASREHFMKPAMLQSQLDTLEPPAADERHVTVDISASRAEVNEAVTEKLAELETATGQHATP
ncbi:gluconokinase [Propionibacteriaceae bacterium Y1685]|uniref:gluconokinase n=1 Tax=Microlunatus sp. Y1700 TaxID=3418487 RepID=UPI003B78885C